jgi:hypothetical protein
MLQCRPSFFMSLWKRLPLVIAVALSSGTAVFVRAQAAKEEQSQTPVSPAPTAGVPGAADHHAVVNLAELARREAAAPARSDERVSPNVAPFPLPVPEPTVAPGVMPRSQASGVVPEAPPTGLQATQAREGEPAPAPPTLSASFAALEDNPVDGFSYIPPDTHGAVGLNHLMVTLNSQIRIQTRAGTTLNTVGLNTFWSAVAGGSGVFDPKVLYDPFSNRWIFTACDDPRSGSSGILMGVSQTSDPTGTWNLYKQDADADDVVWADYPSIGFNKDWIVVSVNMFTSANAFSREHVYVFNKADLYANGTGLFTLFSRTGIGGTLVPAITYDNSLATMYLIQNFTGDSGGNGYLRAYTITGSVGSEALNNDAADQSNAIFIEATGASWSASPAGGADFAPQSGTTRKVQNNDNRLQNVVYRNGRLWTTHTIFLPAGGTPTRSAIQWWELDPSLFAVDNTAPIVQRGRIDDAAALVFRAFPSVAVNLSNDVVIGYSQFSAAQFPSAVFATRSSTDPVNTVTETALKAGEAKYDKDFGTGKNRWGDYSNTVVDPANDSDIWTIQEYAMLPSGADRWGTWWGKVGFAAALPTLAINDVTLTEGNSGSTVATFTVTRTPATLQTVTVNYATADGSAAVSDGDYVATSGTLTFAPGDMTKTIGVTVKGDTKFEPNETFYVNLSGATNATIADNQGQGTITNDDAQPTISINDVSVTEGNAGTTSANFTVSLSNSSSQTITVNYATADATAAAGSDYVAIGSATLTFNPGETGKTVMVTVNGDTKFEPNETFFVNLSGATNATIADNQGQGTITNDDAQPTISINDVTVTEGNAGTTSANFTVSLSNSSSQTITVNYATADGTATAGSDYVAIGSTMVTLNPGETTKLVTVTVNGDSVFELNETFFVNLSGATNATIADSQGQGTITNDDAMPSVSITDVTVAEGNAGTTTATFTVMLSAASAVTATVNFSTADSTAAAPGDYVGTSGMVTFNPGETAKTIDVSVNGDTAFEPNETFLVNLHSPTNATIADSQGLGTITNDDSQPTTSINDVTVAEGNAGTTSANFAVSLSNPSSQMITVNYATSDGTAAGGTDYVAIGSTTLTFNPGETSKTVMVTVNGDTAFEPNETFFVNVSGATNATIADNQGVGTIANDDPQPTISINDVTVGAGSVGTSNANFTVSLSNASFQTITVNYATSDGTATAGSDYVAVGPTTLTFNPGETSKTVTVVVNPNPTFEPDETFFVDLTGAINATIADNQGQGTIVDDSQPSGDGKAVDYTADMKADLAWRNSSTGQVYLWTMDGATPTAFSPVATVSDLNWRIVGQGDFNADAKADLVWYNVSTGQVYIWFMNGATPISFNPVTTVSDLNWRIVATADFNGDGKADLVWHNQSTGQVYIWLMDGAMPTSFNPVATVADLNWRIVVARDFTGDGKADLVWYNRMTGQVYLWPMNGATPTAFSSVATISDLNWRIVAGGDYNGDGKSDLVWHNRSTGAVYIWFMNGATPTSFNPVATVADFHWGIVAAGDFGADGKADLVWYNRETGGVYLWQMDGATPVATSPVATIADLNWGIVHTQ